MNYSGQVNYIAIDILFKLNKPNPTQKEIEQMELLLDSEMSAEDINSYALATDLAFITHKYPQITLANAKKRGLLEKVRYHLKQALKIELSEREIQCLSLWCVAKTWERIGKLLSIAESTVEAHIYRIKSKLNTYRREDLFDVLRGAGVLSLLIEYSTVLHQPKH